MTASGASELLLIRHAPALSGGRLCGRGDVAADCADVAAFGRLAAAVGRFDRLIISPALRCRQTARALWPERAPDASDPRLWEQDFGGWEGLPYADLPDLGPLPPEALAAHRPPGGESFDDLCHRAHPALIEAAADAHLRGGRVVIVAHAGTVRAALALALGGPGAALAYEVAPLSLTRLGVTAATLPWTILASNERFE